MNREQSRNRSPHSLTLTHSTCGRATVRVLDRSNKAQWVAKQSEPKIAIMIFGITSILPLNERSERIVCVVWKRQPRTSYMCMCLHSAAIAGNLAAYNKIAIQMSLIFMIAVVGHCQASEIFVVGPIHIYLFLRCLALRSVVCYCVTFANVCSAESK